MQRSTTKHYEDQEGTLDGSVLNRVSSGNPSPWGSENPEGMGMKESRNHKVWRTEGYNTI